MPLMLFEFCLFDKIMAFVMHFKHGFGMSPLFFASFADLSFEVSVKCA